MDKGLFCRNSRTRAEIADGQCLNGIDADGSYTIRFGPKAPKGHKGNCVQTMPGKSYIAWLRLYGPLQPWVEKTWRPGEIELVD